MYAAPSVSAVRAAGTATSGPDRALRSSTQHTTKPDHGQRQLGRRQRPTQHHRYQPPDRLPRVERTCGVHRREDRRRARERVGADDGERRGDADAAGHAAFAAHHQRHHQRDDADHAGELHQRTEAADHARGRRVLPLREHDRTEQGDTHEDVVAPAVDEVQRGERAEGEERDRIGRTRPSPHDDAGRHQRRRGQTLVEEARPEHRRAQHHRCDPGQRGERGAVHRRRVPPGVPDEREQRVVRVLHRDVRVRARVVHREDASVDRVPPEVLGRAGRAGQSDDGLQRDGGADELDREARRGAPCDQREVGHARDRDERDVRAVRERPARADDDRGGEGGDDQGADTENGGPRRGGQSSSAGTHHSTDRSGGSLRLRSAHHTIVVPCR